MTQDNKDRTKPSIGRVGAIEADEKVPPADQALLAAIIGPWVPMERYRFTISDGDSFEHAGEAVYASPLAAEAHATQVAKELSEDGDTWHGGWISVDDTRGNEIARVPIGIERTPTKSEVARRSSQLAIRKSNTIILRLDEAAARRAGRPPDRDPDRDD